MNQITQYQSKRPNVGIIYGGIVAHTAKLYHSFLYTAAQVPKPKRKATVSEQYKAEINHFVKNSRDFLKDKKGREVFSIAEIADYLGLTSYHVSRNFPEKYFAAKGKDLLFRTLLGKGGSSLRGVALKNIFMWNNAPQVEVNAHIKKFINTK